mgnify:FL=1
MKGKKTPQNEKQGNWLYEFFKSKAKREKRGEIKTLQLWIPLVMGD